MPKCRQSSSKQRGRRQRAPSNAQPGPKSGHTRTLEESVNPLGDDGSVRCALTDAVLARGNVRIETLGAYMATLDDDELWSVIGPIVDRIEDNTRTLQAIINAGAPKL